MRIPLYLHRFLGISQITLQGKEDSDWIRDKLLLSATQTLSYRCFLALVPLVGETLVTIGNTEYYKGGGRHEVSAAVFSSNGHSPNVWDSQSGAKIDNILVHTVLDD